MEEDYSKYIPLVIIALLTVMQIVMRLSSRLARGKKVSALEGIASKEQLQMERLVIYFTSGFCGPCKTMAPMIDSLMNETGAIIKLDALEYGEMATEMGARGAPAFVLVENGVINKVHLGALTEKRIKEMLKL
ncbi:MAG: thioredoxin family protein [Gammaproteobacteria bacterium]|nr:thioredoxin family protein [Gammaproteobacteria bacterium]